MSYTKQTWANGDVITAAKLNHMEDGIAGAGGILWLTNTGGTLDKTWQEIYDALSANTLVFICNVDSEQPSATHDWIFSANFDSEVYVVAGYSTSYWTETVNGYPILD